MSAANIEQIANSLLQKLKLNPGCASSAVNVLQTCFELVNGMLTTSTVEDKKVVLVKVLDKVAAGQDGVLGTADDIISPEVLANLKTLLETKMATDIINMLNSLNLNVESIKTKCCPCLPS